MPRCKRALEAILSARFLSSIRVKAETINNALAHA
jgi:hypothetical protein